MTTYSYNLNIPDGPNNPSDDQPKMQTNTNSTSAIIGEDHVTFQAQNGGMHKWARIINTTVTPPIAGMIANAGGVYTRRIRSNNQLLFANGTSPVEYQLTSISASNIATFATNTNYGSGGGQQFFGGWSFLPGQWGGNTSQDDAMLLQYGLVTPSTFQTVSSVTFPRAYNNAAFSVTATPIRNSTNAQVIYIVSVSASGFTYISTSGSGVTGFYWMAMGV